MYRCLHCSSWLTLRATRSPPRHLVLLDDAVLADDGKAVGVRGGQHGDGADVPPCRAAN